MAPRDVSSPSATVGNGTPGSCTEAALRTALTNGGTVVCNCGPGAVVNVTSEFVLDRNVVLDGGGVTLDGGGSTRLFRKRCVTANQTNSLSLTLQNITLRNGRADTLGGAVRNETFGRFYAVNVNFEHNTCALLATPDWGGGAVHSVMQTEMVFSGCTFVGNTGANGGAIGGIGNSMIVVDCVFDSNTATGNGGGADAGPNGKGGIGGAVYIDNVDINGQNNYVRFCNSAFRNSRSNAHAGAIFAYFRPGCNSVGSVDRCTFESNSESVNQAGAIYQQNGTFTITNSTFTKNSAVTQGGALWVTREASDASLPVTVTNCTFEGNSLSGEWSMGGGITNSGTQLTVTNCTFANNTVRHFGCAIKNSGTLFLSNTLLHNNVLTDGPNNNGWAGMAIDKNTTLTDQGGNLCFPASFPEWGVDEWLNQNPGVLRLDPLLRPLADNGGPTQTMAIPQNSPAVNAGTGSGCPPADQRGVTREGTCDIGAYEYSSSVVREPSRSATQAQSVRGASALLIRAGEHGVDITSGTKTSVHDLRGRLLMPDGGPNLNSQAGKRR
jgi:hypothetical protein